MAKNIVTLEQVKKYNEIIGLAVGTAAANLVALRQEYKDDDKKKWYFSDPYYPRRQMISVWDDGEYSIKSIDGLIYLYMNLDGSPADRYCLDTDFARKFFIEKAV